jgi:hypothetical protein
MSRDTRPEVIVLASPVEDGGCNSIAELHHVSDGVQLICRSRNHARVVEPTRDDVLRLVYSAWFARGTAKR